MKSYTENDVKRYLENDFVLKLMEDNMNDYEREIRTNQWMSEMENKRAIYADVYGDLLCERDKGRAILDVGGAYNALTKVLAENNKYTLLDFMAHGGSDYLKNVSKEYHISWRSEDWYECKDLENYDIIIANDIFPDVDQRMELFLDKMLKKCKELRLVLTYYNAPKFYTTKRVDDTEIMTFLSWDGEITALKLRKYLKQSDATQEELERMKTNNTSIFHNGRQVAYIKFRGELG